MEVLHFIATTFLHLIAFVGFSLIFVYASLGCIAAVLALLSNFTQDRSGQRVNPFPHGPNNTKNEGLSL